MLQTLPLIYFQIDYLDLFRLLDSDAPIKSRIAPGKVILLIHNRLYQCRQNDLVLGTQLTSLSYRRSNREMGKRT